MKFNHNDFSCDVDVYRNESDLVVKFYDSAKVQSENEIHDLVIVDPGYGYINLKLFGEEKALLSGFLDENIFATNEMIQSAITFVQNLLPNRDNVWIPYHVEKVKLVGYEEYNGEY